MFCFTVKHRHLTMNPLTNGQHNHTITKMRNLLRKFMARFFHFMVSLIGPLPTFFLLRMQELGLHAMWFQQDSATCHTARVAMDLLRDEFGEHFISCSGPVN